VSFTSAVPSYICVVFCSAVLINGVNNLKLCYVMLSTSTYPACDIDNRSPFGSDFFRGGIRKENENYFITGWRKKILEYKTCRPRVEIL
jgi:hypothetical protein